MFDGPNYNNNQFENEDVVNKTFGLISQRMLDKQNKLLVGTNCN